MNNFLILSGLKYLFPEKKNNNIYSLYEDHFENKKTFQEIYSKVLIEKNRWSNRKILKKDKNYLFKLNKEIINNIYKKLNELHKVNYSKKFWSILISPWSIYFLQLIFNRWHQTQMILKKNKISHVNIVEFKNEKNLTPSDTKEFHNYYQGHLWNQYVNQKILFFLTKKIKYIKKKKIISIKITPKVKEKKNIFINFFSFLLKFANKKNYKYFIYSTYLGMWREFLLNVKLNQLPSFEKIKFEFKKDRIKLDLKKRSKLINHIKPKNKFEKFFYNIFILQLPYVFFEKFPDLEKSFKSINLPTNPSKILSAEALWEETGKNYYIAKLLENNSKLYTIQHGGTYGIAQTHFNTNYELENSDKFISWGSSFNKNSKVIKLGTIKKKYNLKQNKNDTGNLLFIINKRHKYKTYLNTSLSHPFNFTKTLKFNTNFLLNLKDDIQKQTIIRPMPNTNFVKDYDFFENLRYKFKFNSSKPVLQCYKESKIAIHSLNSTSMLETLYYNMPTIIIYDSKIDPFTKEAQKIFKKLKKNNIFFDNPVSAALFVNKIWNKGVYDWWYSPKVQKTVNNFNLIFCKHNSKMLIDLKNLLSKR